MRRNNILILLLLGLAVVASHARKTRVVPQNVALSTFPDHIGQWRVMEKTLFDEPVLKVLRASDYLMRSYADPQGRQLGLYVGYHDGGPDAGPIHSPRNCLPGSGWTLLDSRIMTMGSVHLVRATYQKEHTGIIYYYWYQMRDQSLTSDFALKTAEFQGILLHGRRDASFIRLHVSRRYEQEADALASDFIQKVYPLLRAYLPS